MPRQDWPPADTAAERIEGLPLLLSGATFDALEAAARRRRLSPGELVHQLIAAFLGQEPLPPAAGAPAPAHPSALVHRGG